MDRQEIQASRFGWYCDYCGGYNISNIAFLNTYTPCVVCGKQYEVGTLLALSKMMLGSLAFEKGLENRAKLLAQEEDVPKFAFDFPVTVKGYGKIVNVMQLFVFIRAMEGIIHSYKDLMVYSQALESKIEILQHPVDQEPLFEPEPMEPPPDIP